MKYLRLFEDVGVFSLEMSKKTKLSQSQQKYTYWQANLIFNKKVVSCCKVYFTNEKQEIYTGYNTETFDDKKPIVLLVDVSSKIKNKGFGKKLFEFLIEDLKSKNIKRIYLDVDHENTNALKFYKRLGFKTKFIGYFKDRYYLNIK